MSQLIFEGTTVSSCVIGYHEDGLHDDEMRSHAKHFFEVTNIIIDFIFLAACWLMRPHTDCVASEPIVVH
jgi:hypothetical protein